MQLRPLGNTGIDVSPIGLGTVKIGRNRGVKYPRDFALPGDEQVRDLLDTARDLGVNLLDTAPAYGTSEERLGPLVAPSRDHWIIVTKVGEEFEDGVSRFDFSPEHTRFSVERSLERLRSDHLDCVLVHSDGNDERIIDSLGTLDALAELKSRGLIRSFGMSTKTLTGARKAMGRSDVLMLTYNQREPEMGPVIAETDEAGVGVLIKKGLASGHLAATATNDHAFRGAVRPAREQTDAAAPDAADPIASALRFIFARPGVGSVITGTISPAHLRQNVEAVDKTLAT
jgi:aryl-alcohol dehydrogenase-like predicted oxidoreductase